LLNVLGLLDSPTTGSYMLDGRPVEQLAEKDQARLRSTSIGFVFQQSFLLPYLTARENVELPLRRRRLPGSERRRRALEALKSVQLEARGDALPPTLSGGEAQRVAVARALAQEPSILLCDEPTGNLDERTSSEVTELIRKQSDRGVVVIMVTHDLALARAFPRILTVRDGVIAEGLDPRLLADGNGQRN
jgi:putative ABC transport system ATP-binding protein